MQCVTPVCGCSSGMQGKCWKLQKENRETGGRGGDMEDIWPTYCRHSCSYPNSKKMEGEVSGVWSQVIHSLFQTHVGGSPGEQDSWASELWLPVTIATESKEDIWISVHVNTKVWMNSRGNLCYTVLEQSTRKLYITWNTEGKRKIYSYRVLQSVAWTKCKISTIL